ncbi:MAG: site-specific integrase [Rickettsiales bacterium]|nr:site-specific integrase [Rickettsiales bacterium]
MATIEKRTNNDGSVGYRVKVRLKGHPVQTATFQRLTDAKHWVQNTEAAIREGRHFKTSKAKKYTLGQLIDKYSKEILALSDKDTENQKHYLKYWKEHLGAYVLADVTPALICEHRNNLLGMENSYGRKIGASTANRYSTALGHVFTVAVKQWEWLESNPVQRIQKLNEPRGRVRFLSDDERKALLDACKQSDNPYLHMIVVLALSTGARKNEIIALKWQDVSLERGMMTLHETKNGERRALPLQGYAYKLMLEHAKVRRLDCDYVFPSEKKKQPIDIRTAWENAVERAELQDFRFHDLRHSAASYLAMNGASLAEIAEVLGHKTLQMVKRYAHLSEAHTSKVVASMNERIFG